MTDDLQQAWHEESKLSKWRRSLYIVAAIFSLIIISGLLIICWPTAKGNASTWKQTIATKAHQLVIGLKEWQNNNEKKVIEGDILK
ncbi:MAG TPA: hypothetical protein PKN62_00545 [bacterium]|mgnify:CR=1 FL=1|nr:hypothetical protein [bacterium]